MTIDEKIEKINILEKRISQERKQAFTNFNKLVNQIQEEYKELFPFEGKFLKIKHSLYDDCNKYMFCDSVKKTTNIHEEPIINIHGWGFEFEITEYCDETYAHWSEWMDEDVRLYDITTEVKRFEIISKEEFQELFNEMILKLKNKFIEKII